jgi:hemoglobin
MPLSNVCNAISIYDRLGGHEAIEGIVEDFYTRVLVDDQLSSFFAGTNMNRMKGMSTEYFAAALGGPDRYTGLSIKRAHRGRGIGMDHFNLVVGHLKDSLTAAEVPAETTAEILEVVGPLAGDIV